MPRLIDSTVRAFGIREIKRSAQYFSMLEKEEVEELLEVDTQKQRKLLSRAGLPRCTFRAHARRDYGFGPDRPHHNR